jgi:hypothetical protein
MVRANGQVNIPCRRKIRQEFPDCSPWTLEQLHPRRTKCRRGCTVKAILPTRPARYIMVSKVRGARSGHFGMIFQRASHGHHCSGSNWHQVLTRVHCQGNFAYITSETSVRVNIVQGEWSGKCLPIFQRDSQGEYYCSGSTIRAFWLIFWRYIRVDC